MIFTLGGHKRDAAQADKRKALVNSKLSAPSKVLVPVIPLPLTIPVIVSIDQTPVLPVGDASIVPLPGNGTPPRSGEGPVSDQSKTFALAGSSAAPSGKAAIIPAGKTDPRD